MSDYISREALIDRLNNNLSACNHGTFSEMCYADAIETAKNLPAADVEPVVRCKDCKHLRVWNQKDIYAFCPKTNIVFLPFEKDTRTFFCSLGEAKMNGGIENASKEM